MIRQTAITQITITNLILVFIAFTFLTVHQLLNFASLINIILTRIKLQHPCSFVPLSVASSGNLKYYGIIRMKKNLTHKILQAHLAEGQLIPGSEIAIKIDHTLLQDATGTLAMLEFEALGLDRVKVELAAQYVDHNLLQTDNKNADDHKFLQTAAAGTASISASLATESRTRSTWNGSEFRAKRFWALTVIHPAPLESPCWELERVVWM